MTAAPFKRFFPLLVLALLPCLLLWRVVFLGEAFVPADLLRDVAPWRAPSSPNLVPWNPLMWDGVAEFYPWRAFAAQTIHAGWLPLWNPHQFCGTPFVANSQSAVFYPLNVIFYVLPVKAAFGASAWLHLTLTSWFLYGFLRNGSLKTGRTAALLGATVWQLSAWQTAWLALPTFLCVSTWLPLALRLTDRTMEKPSAARAAGLGACLGVMFLAGHLQIALYCFLLTAAYAVFRAVSTRLPARRFLPLAALALALMAGFAAPQILPSLELARVSHRAGAAVSGAGYLSYVGLATPLIYLVTLISPGFFGNPTQGTYWGLRGPTDYPENACSIGLIALALAFAAVRLFGRSSPSIRFFAVAALVALLMALGAPLDALLYFGIPGFGQTGSPGRILVLWTFCAAVLAAAGLEGIATARYPGEPLPPPPSPERRGGVGEDSNGEDSEEKKSFLLTPPLRSGEGDGGRSSSLLAFLFFALAAFVYTAWWLGKNAPPGILLEKLGTAGDVWRLPLGIVMGVGALAVLRGRGTLSGRAFRVGLVALTALELLLAGVGYNGSAPARAVYPTTPGIAWLQQHAGFERILPVNHRWSLFTPPPAVLPPNAGTVYGLFDTQGYDSLLTGQYARFARDLNGGWGFAPPENGNMVFTDGYTSSLAASAAARYVVSLGFLPADPAFVPVFQDGGMVVYENRQAQKRARVTEGTGEAVLESVTATRLAARVERASAQGKITVADQWYPGWRAMTNGQIGVVEAGTNIFRTVRWSGKRGDTIRVEMRYQPTAFQIGLYALCLSLATAAGLGTAALSGRGRHRRR